MTNAIIKKENRRNRKECREHDKYAEMLQKNCIKEDKKERKIGKW